MTRRTPVLAVLLAVIAIVILPATGAGAATAYDVTVGTFLASAPAESMRFLPGTIDVHQGDTLHFTSQGFHTATMLPVGAGVVDWMDANATIGTSQPYALVQPNPDNGPNAYKFGNLAGFPTSSTCGGASQPACSYDGTTVLNSGAPLFSNGIDLSATINASVGSSFWVVCLVHGPNMRMKVNVVASSSPASDPAALDKANKNALAQDNNSAAALTAKFSQKQTWHTAPNGHRVWDAWAGVDNRHVAVYGMFPHTLKISKGDTVQWHFDSLNFELHTVTFPLDKAKKIANSMTPVCDPDGPGPGPDNPPDLMAPPFCSNVAQLELQFDNRFVPPQGDGNLSKGSELQSSGVRGAFTSTGDANYDLKFGATSSAQGFKYICMIHPFMRGRVVVR